MPNPECEPPPAEQGIVIPEYTRFMAGLHDATMDEVRRFDTDGVPDIAAPRERTRNLKLRGRVFLHHHDHEQDTDGVILDPILSAPMLVASRINL